MKEKKITRRSFVKKSSLATAETTVGMSALANSSILGSNEKIRMGFIGVGNRVFSQKALPVFADTDPKTFTINPHKIEDKIKDNLKFAQGVETTQKTN